MKYPVIVATLLLMPTLAQAVGIAEGSVLCITQSYLQKYENHLKAKQIAFIKDMEERAQCYRTGHQLQAAVLGENGAYIRVEILDGHIVWVKRDSLQDGNSLNER